MKKRAHIPHNYEMSFENCQGEVSCVGRWCATTPKKQNHVSQQTDVFATHQSASRNGRFTISTRTQPLNRLFSMSLKLSYIHI